MKQEIIDTRTNTRIGFLSSLEEVENITERLMFEPFCRQYNYIVFKDWAGKFGIYCPDFIKVQEVAE